MTQRPALTSRRMQRWQVRIVYAGRLEAQEPADRVPGAAPVGAAALKPAIRASNILRKEEGN